MNNALGSAIGQVIFSRHMNLSRAIHYHLNKITVPEVLKKRVDAYLETELCYDKGYRVVTSEDVLGTLSHDLSGNWKYERFGHFINRVPLFMETDQGWLREPQFPKSFFEILIRLQDLSRIYAALLPSGYSPLRKSYPMADDIAWKCT